MTVKVVDEKLDKSVVKEVVCRGCGVKLQYALNDIRGYYGIDISGGPNSRDWIVCAKCGKDVILYSW